jgi:PKD repeat protein
MLMFACVAATSSLAATANTAALTAQLVAYQIGPLTVLADASGSSVTTPITSYHFDFGDGTATTSTSPQAQHAYAQLPALPVTITVTVTDSAGDTATTTKKVRVAGAYVPMQALRVLDTRSSTGQFGGLYPRENLQLQIGGHYGIPSDATAIVFNLTATNAGGVDFLSVDAAAGGQPAATSNLNIVPGQTVANMVTARLDIGGDISIYNHSAPVDVIVDLIGYYTATPASSTGGMLTMITPQRMLDTRTGLGTAGPGPIAGGGQALVDLNPIDQHRYPITPLVDVTAINPQTSGFLRVTGDDLNPDASNINFAPGETIANEAIPTMNPVHPGLVQIANHGFGGVDVVTDAVGYFSGPNDRGEFDGSGMGFTPVYPSRVVDTRGGAAPGLGPDSTLDQPVTSVAFLPSDAAAVVLNVTVTNPTDDGYLTVFAAGSPRPATSNLNFTAGQTLAAQVYVPLGPNGDIDIYNHTGTADVIVDIQGYFSG